MSQSLFPDLSSMSFDPSIVSFGGHEKFPLRYGWLSKGFHAFSENHNIFKSDTATIDLGVGNNMIKAIKYWLLATQMLRSPKQSILEPSTIGHFLLDKQAGVDPYLEDEATIWLLHWLLASNPSGATAWFWFFNQFHKSEFTADELSTALHDFSKDKVDEKRRPAMGTVKNDAQLLTRMYVQSKLVTRKPIEDALDSPLSLLHMMSQSYNARSFLSKSAERPGLPIGILGYAVSSLIKAKNTAQLPIETIMYSNDLFPAPGSVFRLTENSLIEKLERLIQWYPGIFDIRETSGIHQLHCLNNEHDSLVFLEQHYAAVEKGEAA